MVGLKAQRTSVVGPVDDGVDGAARDEVAHELGGIDLGRHLVRQQLEYILHARYNISPDNSQKYNSTNNYSNNKHKIRIIII